MAKRGRLITFFLHCSAAKFMWRLLQCTFSLKLPIANMNTLFTYWLDQYGKEKTMMLTIGISAMIWSIWNCRNEICFDCRRVLDRSTIFSELCKWRVLKRKFFTISGSLFIRKANALGTKSRTKTCRCKDKISNSTTSDINYFRKVINNARERWMWSKQSTRSHSAHEN